MGQNVPTGSRSGSHLFDKKAKLPSLLFFPLMNYNYTPDKFFTPFNKAYQ